MSTLQMPMNLSLSLSLSIHPYWSSFFINRRDGIQRPIADEYKIPQAQLTRVTEYANCISAEG